MSNLKIFNVNPIYFFSVFKNHLVRHQSRWLREQKRGHYPWMVYSSLFTFSLPLYSFPKFVFIVFYYRFRNMREGRREGRRQRERERSQSLCHFSKAPNSQAGVELKPKSWSSIRVSHVSGEDLVMCSVITASQGPWSQEAGVRSQSQKLKQRTLLWYAGFLTHICKLVPPSSLQSKYCID